MKPIAVLDSCVLYPYHLRDFLIRIFISGNLYRPRWSEDIHVEWSENLLRNRPELDKVAIRRTIDLMNKLPETLVQRQNYQHLISECHLPDPKDNHVLATAIYCEASYIVTFNLKDFPSPILSNYGIKALHPDDFVLDLMESNRAAVLSSLQSQVISLKNPPMNAEQLKERLISLGLTKSMKLLS